MMIQRWRKVTSALIVKMKQLGENNQTKFMIDPIDHGQGWGASCNDRCEKAENQKERRTER